MEVTGVLTAILIGLVVGILGRLVVPGRQPIGLILTLLVGVGAALLGTYVADQAGWSDADGFSWVVLLLQVGFAAAGVFLMSLVAGHPRDRVTGRR